MKGYLKIPREWLTDWKLTGNECVLLADILDWNTNNQDERAFRVNMTTRGVRKVLKRLEEQEQSSSLIKAKRDNKEEQSSYKRGTKFRKREEQSSLPPTPPYIEEHIEEHKELGLTIVSPAETSSAPTKKSAQRKEKKYTPEESKLHGELKAIFDEEWVSAFGDSFYWDGAEMAGLVKIKKQIQFKMKSNECDPNDAEQIKFNFRFFIHKILTSLDNWTKENSSPKTIAGRFNVIYNQLKNGKSSSNTADNFHVFGSRNITPDILAEFT